MTAKRNPKAKQRTLDDFPSLEQSKRKLQELRSQLAETERRISGLISQPVPTVQEDAKAILRGDDFDDEHNTQALKDLSRRRKALRVAVDGQHRKVREDQHAAAREILDERRPEYEEIVREINKAIPALARLLQREQDWRRDRLDELAINSFHFEIAPVNSILAAVGEYQRQAVENGLLRETDVVAIDDVRLQLW